jgi:HAD superfamily PSPase-like hydrolase
MKNLSQTYALAVFDIDGTLRREKDPWMLLHRQFGTEKEGTIYYEQWSNGEISYEEMTRLDVKCWKGIPRDEMLKVLKHNPIRKGAHELIDWFRQKNVPCVGVSTGIDLFNNSTAKDLGMDEVVSNNLLFDNDICTGEVVINVEEARKDEILKTFAKKYQVELTDIISFGDGDADIALFKNSAVSVAVFPRNHKVKESADFIIESEPIDSILKEL